MSEFNEKDLNQWLQLSMDQNCSVYDAIKYLYYFDGQEKVLKAYGYMLRELKLKNE